MSDRSYPRGPLDLVCGEPYENADLTGLTCHLSAGHRGDHEATTVVTWSQDGQR